MSGKNVVFVGKLALALAAALFCAFMAQAKVCCFRLGESDESNRYYWSNSNNWVNCQMPVSGDSVYVTNMTSCNVVHDIGGLTLAHFEYICTCGSLIGVKKITLTGTDNIVSNTATYYDYGTYEISDGARLTYCGTATAQAAKDNVWSGAGEIAVWLGGSACFYYSYYHPNFTGTVNFYHANTMYFGTGSNKMYGFPSARINVYGENTAEGWKSGFQNGMADDVILYGEYHFYRKQTFTAQYRTIIAGDVYLHAATANEVFQFNPYGRASDVAGFIFNGAVYKCPDGVQARMIHYTYGTKNDNGHNDSIIEFNGGGDFGTYGIEFSFQNGGTGAIVRVGAPITMSGSNPFITLENAVRLYTTAPNVLPPGAVMNFGKASTNCRGVLFDLMGNDQKVGKLPYNVSAGYELEATIASSGGPATLDMVTVSGAAARNMPKLNGPISVKVRGVGDSAGAYNHMDGDTTGWIKSDGWVQFMCSNSLPNVAGFEMVGKGVLWLNADATLNPAMELNLHNLTNNASGLCGVCVESGSNRTVGRVLYDFVDVPAGTYCRAGAGVAGATEAAWMRGNASYNGTITVAAHDPLYVWTGNGADGSLATGGNWAGGVAPDLSSATTTVDFRYASADKPIALSGSLAPACTIADSTPFDKGDLAFEGDGTLVLSGSGVVTNGWAFTDRTALVWNGPGTLVLAGASASAGAISVSAGKVVVAEGQWLGGASVAAGAELEIESGCGDEVFGIDDPSNRAVLTVNGKLTLGDGVEACVKYMTIGGANARGRRAYGSSESASAVTDDVHFGGSGTVMSIAKSGIILIVE